MAVYIHLFHGRKDPAEQLEDWGEDGPVLGPFRWVHTTYACDIKLGSLEPRDDAVGSLYIVEYLVYYAGVWYGDWLVFDDECVETDKSVPQLYDENKAWPPGTKTAGGITRLPLKPHTAKEGAHA
ncbi:hypothetical protein LCGC14_0399560 [marine sediment metagenome]|uniref:Uncharacterized protein n=1 Tax=marine sediment metagenome TaxID=412755 RepID=A0A0F9T2Q2_9ZZZZ